MGALLARWIRQVLEPNGQRMSDLFYVNVSLAALLMPTGLIVVLFALSAWIGSASGFQAFLHLFGTFGVWSLACLMAGVVVGFLFGIPKTAGLPRLRRDERGEFVADPSRDNTWLAARPNSNLEEVSDWLTKIIVGVGLVNLETIRVETGRIVGLLAASLAAAPVSLNGQASKGIAFGLIVGMLAIGFLFGYLYTRLFLQNALNDADQQTFGSAYSQAVQSAQQQLPPTALPPAGEPASPSPAVREAAARVASIAPARSPSETLRPMLRLADEYEAVRQSMPQRSDERTLKLEAIVDRMRVVAQAASPFLSDLLAGSPSAGRRLAAVICLQLAFKPDHIEWLADRLAEETAFIGFHAASALFNAMPSAGPLERQRISKAVTDAKARIVEKDSHRDAIIERILAFD